MEYKILHESKGRLRLQMQQRRITVRQADQLEVFLQAQSGIQKVTVHERTCCVILYYAGEKKKVLSYFQTFQWEEVSSEQTEWQSARQIHRFYEEKLVSMIVFKLLRSFFLPPSLAMLYHVCRALPYLFKGLRCLLRRKLKVELLDAISIGISLLRGDSGTAGSIMFLLTLGEVLEEWTHKKSTSDLARYMSLHVDRIWLKTSKGEVLTPVSQIQTGDIVVARMGSVIALDGVLEQGTVMVNQASLTGESIPVPKQAGMMVYAGSVIEEGQCLIRVTQQEGSSRYDKIVEMIEQTEKLKSEAEHKATNLADRLVPYTLLGSVATWLLSGNALRAQSVLMVDFSCALKLAMPLAVLSAMREAALHHITVKGGKYLEAVAQADTIVFDKTGTLTYASPRVMRVVPFGNHSEREMLRLAACLEEHFPHSMANAVVKAARDQNLSHEEMPTEVEYIVAHGIASSVSGKRVLIGSAHFVFEDEGCRLPVGEEEKFQSLPSEYSHLYLTIGGELAAVICIADPLRLEAAEVIKRLRQTGIAETIMLTGDSQHTARAIAAQVGVDTYQSEMLPEDKAAYVQHLKEKGKTVIMLGDGINDSPALSVADVGIAVSEGAAITREIADITIAEDGLYELVILRRLAQKLMQRIRFNYRFVIGFNGALIALGALGLLPPAAAATLHNVSTLGISLKSMTRMLEEK